MKTLKTLNKVSKIVVTKLKINTVLCKDCFFFFILQHMRPPYILWANIWSVPQKHGTWEEQVSDMVAKVLSKW